MRKRIRWLAYEDLGSGNTKISLTHPGSDPPHKPIGLTSWRDSKQTRLVTRLSLRTEGGEFLVFMPRRRKMAASSISTLMQISFFRWPALAILVFWSSFHAWNK